MNSAATPAVAANKKWPRVFTFLALGYITMGRSFAYWGIPPLYLFVGEIFLAWFLLAGPVAEGGRWPSVALKSPALLRFKKRFFLFLAFGVFEVFHGIIAGHPPVSAVRDLAFNYYPFYFLLGLWVGLQDRNFLRRFLPVAAWVNGIYGVLFIFVLNRLPWLFPGTSQEISGVPIFGQPEYSAAILMGLVALDKDWRPHRLVLFLNGFVLIGMLIRSQWLAFALAIAVFAWLTRDRKKVQLAAGAVLIPLLLMYVTDFSIPGPETRGGTISVRDMVGRAVAPVAPDVAADLTEDAAMNVDTATFRTIWWFEIWVNVHDGFSRTLIGYGYGFPLGNLVSYLEESSTRTPHNAFFFALGYTGWIGVCIFFALQLEIFRMLWKVYRMTGQSFGIVFWVAEVLYSLFTAFFEAPYGAIPFYLVVGCACATYFSAHDRAPDYTPESVVLDNRSRAMPELTPSNKGVSA
jgi:hypothetical protein